MAVSLWCSYYLPFSREATSVQHQRPNQGAGHPAAQAGGDLPRPGAGREAAQGKHPQGLGGVHQEAQEGPGPEEDAGGQVQDPGVPEQETAPQATGDTYSMNLVHCDIVLRSTRQC